MRDYIGLIFGGLAGSQTLVSATVLALAKLTHSFRLELPEDLMQLILENVCLLSAVPTREIVGPCLGYFKVFITSFQKQRVLPYVPTIVSLNFFKYFRVNKFLIIIFEFLLTR